MSDDRFIDAPPSGSDAWREVWQSDRRYVPQRDNIVVAFLRRLFRRAAAPDLDRQRDFNLVVLDLLTDVRREIESLRCDLKADLASVQQDVVKADDALAAEVARVEKLIPIAAMRNDALIAALDQKIETLAVRVRDVTNPLVTTGPSEQPAASNFLYRRLEDGLRGSEAEVRQSVMPYVERARTRQPVIDAGCGRGELLAACCEAGIEARGFDTNERSVADLRQRGFDVTLAGVPECFGPIADGSVGTVVAMHVVEHLPVEALFALFREAARVLRADGLLIIETPNAEALAMSASEFWRDPTHLAPRHPAALILLGREYGFVVDEVRGVHPFPEGSRLRAADDDPPSFRRLVDALNERLFGAQDLRLILKKG